MNYLLIDKPLLSKEASGIRKMNYQCPLGPRRPFFIFLTLSRRPRFVV